MLFTFICIEAERLTVSQKTHGCHDRSGQWLAAMPKPKAESETMSFFLCVLGMVFIIEGLPYFAVPEKMKGWVAKIIEMPVPSLRGMGLVMMIAGLFLVYLGKSG